GDSLTWASLTGVPYRSHRAGHLGSPRTARHAGSSRAQAHPGGAGGDAVGARWPARGSGAPGDEALYPAVPPAQAGSHPSRDGKALLPRLRVSGSASIWARRQSAGAVALAPRGASPCPASSILLYITRFLHIS